MNNSALKDIQQALNIIRAEIEQVDSETKIAALELIMNTSQSVVAMARKLTTPKVRTKTVAIPKTKIVKQQVGQKAQEKEPQNKPSIIKPIKPIAPLQNKQSTY
jgi:glutathione synthase/RimK-type ligase-like ATP-grasp enzyme